MLLKRPELCAQVLGRQLCLELPPGLERLAHRPGPRADRDYVEPMAPAPLLTPPEAPVGPEAAAEALGALAEALGHQSAELEAQLEAIPDREQILIQARPALKGQAFPAVRSILATAQERLDDAACTEDPAAAQALRVEAAGNLASALVLNQVQQLQVAYLAMAAAADTAGAPSAQTTQYLAAMERSLEPLVTEALSFDAERITQALSREAPALEHAQAFLKAWARNLDDGAELSRKAIAMAEAALIVLSIYQVGQALAGVRLEGGPTIRPSGPTGLAVATVPTVSGAELQAALRRLVHGGALEGLRAPTNVPAAPAPLPSLGKPALATTPSGVVSPSQGPYRGRDIEYGDGRDKHTRLAGFGLKQVQAWLKDPTKAPDWAAKQIRRLKSGDPSVGGQLTQEGVEIYEKLVADAAERGLYQGTRVWYKADRLIGIDVETGKPTAWYSVHGLPHSAHVVPEEPTGRIRKLWTQQNGAQ